MNEYLRALATDEEDGRHGRPEDGAFEATPLHHEVHRFAPG